jgi:hypothetical protein
VPHGILRVFNTILYENKFRNPQIFQQTISFFPEQFTLVDDQSIVDEEGIKLSKTIDILDIRETFGKQGRHSGLTPGNNFFHRHHFSPKITYFILCDCIETNFFNFESINSKIGSW